MTRSIEARRKALAELCALFPGQESRGLWLGGVCSRGQSNADISVWVQEIGSNFSHSPDGNVGPGSIEIQSEPGAPDDIAKINMWRRGRLQLPG